MTNREQFLSDFGEQLGIDLDDLIANKINESASRLGCEICPLFLKHCEFKSGDACVDLLRSWLKSEVEE